MRHCYRVMQRNSATLACILATVTAAEAAASAAAAELAAAGAGGGATAAAAAVAAGGGGAPAPAAAACIIQGGHGKFMGCCCCWYATCCRRGGGGSAAIAWRTCCTDSALPAVSAEEGRTPHARRMSGASESDPTPSHAARLRFCRTLPRPRLRGVAEQRAGTPYALWPARRVRRFAVDGLSACGWRPPRPMRSSPAAAGGAGRRSPGERRGALPPPPRPCASTARAAPPCPRGYPPAPRPLAAARTCQVSKWWGGGTLVLARRFLLHK